MKKLNEKYKYNVYIRHTGSKLFKKIYEKSNNKKLDNDDDKLTVITGYHDDDRDIKEYKDEMGMDFLQYLESVGALEEINNDTDVPGVAFLVIDLEGLLLNLFYYVNQLETKLTENEIKDFYLNWKTNQQPSQT